MPRLLIVDDKAENRYVLINFLKLLGNSFQCTVVEADSAKACLEILKADQDFDLIFLDIKMETDNAGIDAVKSIRKDPLLKEKVVWAITARAFNGYEAETSAKELCLNAGYNDYISKPFDPAQLLMKVSCYFSIEIPEKVKQKLGIDGIS